MFLKLKDDYTTTLINLNDVKEIRISDELITIYFDLESFYKYHRKKLREISLLDEYDVEIFEEVLKTHNQSKQKLFDNII